MRNYATYFTYPKILAALVAKRLSLSAKRHDTNFLNNISFRKPNNREAHDSEKILSDIFPPRNRWLRSSVIKRKEATDKPEQLRFKELFNTVMKAKAEASKTGVTPDWLVHLNSLISGIRQSVKSPTALSKIKPAGQAYHVKNMKTAEHRVVVRYSLADSIISSLVCEYLTDHSDTALQQPYFSDNSYAFRSSRLSKKGGRVFSYHSATSDIEKYRLVNFEKGIHVAEVDLAKFYDTVNHSVLLHCLDKMIEQFESQGKPLDHRSIQITRNYLDSFSFSRDAIPNEIKGKREFKWPAAALESLGVNVGGEKIGVPQGGALSCFFANLIMHELDSIFQTDDGELAYLRYCDDFIILHTDKVKCKEYVDKALVKIRELKLVAHSPDEYELTDYRKKIPKKHGSKLVNEFWNSSKSKNPYRWGKYDADNTMNVPYVSFVGYQRRYDGLLRVRKTSLRKEYKKQKKLVRSVLKRVGKENISQIKLSKKRIVFRTQQKLIAMSVGKKNSYNLNRSLGFCWANGFRELNSGVKKFNTQLRYLDRSREEQLGRLRLELRKTSYEIAKPQKGKPVETIPKIFTSYFAYFNRDENKKGSP